MRLTSMGLAGAVAASVLTASTILTAGSAQAGPNDLSATDLNSGPTANQLAQSLVGGGVVVSNVTTTGDLKSIGSFSGGTSTVGLASGVVLSSGAVHRQPDGSSGVEGPNDQDNASYPANTPGDADLTQAIGQQTYDAAVLQFDFVPNYSTVQFSYVFASEEYNEFVNQYNDVFGFYVNGTNCALVPGTTTPVSVDSINTNQHPALFRDNDPSDFPSGATPINAQPDGFTTVLTCNATVNPGVTNHLKLAIADALDHDLDSEVFLGAQSLVSGSQVSTVLKSGTQSGAAITVAPGASITDTATLAGANASTASGTVTYSVYSNATCTSQVASGGTKTVTNGTIPDSNPFVLNSPGTYYVQVAYTGDQQNNPSTSACTDEKVTVSSPDTTPPTCSVVRNNTTPISADALLNDAGSGIASVTVTSSSNATYTIDGASVDSKSYSPPASGTVDVHATRVDNSRSGRVNLKIVDAAGNVAYC